MGILKGAGIELRESMSGWIGVGESDPRAGLERGKQANTTARFDVVIRIDDLEQFLHDPGHPASLEGTVTVPPLGGAFPIRDGRFQLFRVDVVTGRREMGYELHFTAGAQTYWLCGHKEIENGPAPCEPVDDMTRLYTVIYRGEDAQAPVYGAGQLFFHLRDLPSLLGSLQVLGTASWQQRIAAVMAFGSFAFGVLRDEYLGKVNPLYDTQYENLVLAGRMEGAGGAGAAFFFAAGVHDKGFPWGDNEVFWDVLLALGDGRGGYLTYGITDRVLEGLQLDVERGRCRYEGPLYQAQNGYAMSFSELRAGAGSLRRWEAEIEIGFSAQRHDTVPMYFPLVDPLVRKLSADLNRQLRQLLPGERPLGIHITPHTVSNLQASFQLHAADGNRQHWSVNPAASWGEAEQGTFRNVKEPTLLYGYLCGVMPEKKRTRVQVLSRTLRNERTDWAKDRLDACLGTIISRNCSVEMRLEDRRLTVAPLAPAGKPGQRAELLKKRGEPLLELNNDHFPTAVFQRRIVRVEDEAGQPCLALEEDMELLRREALNSSRETTVACCRGEDASAALDHVLEATGFFALLDAKLQASGKNRSAFLIAIKPNFMFAYDKRDRTTYTDPALVGHLVERIRAQGFTKVKVVEAQSTYGEFFDKRSVNEMAEYLGYLGVDGYEVVDMTRDASESMNLGEHAGLHPVSRAWKAADFRISFSKNKTHAYSYYTLTLKNIYGALPRANKFKEYHCGPGIYYPAMEYLRAFPLDYCLIDAWISADGPFGIFADPAPNVTNTIIGGADPVAVDWVGASKMGIDPMISKYMQIAVEWFGKPRIRLVGDASPYRPWLNVPAVLTVFTHQGMDADYHFGNLLYSVSAQMDETHFTHKSNAWYIKLLRKMTVPLRQTFFLRTGENPTALNRFMSWLLYHMGY